MGIIKEHLKILECYEYDDYIVKELEEILDIPESRIRLYTLELFEYYKVTTLNELKAKIRKDKYWRKKIKDVLEISGKDRINFILLNFLRDDIINLNKISLTLEVTRRTITKDLKKIELILKNFELNYESLNSKGIKLIGSENDKKKLLNSILFSVFLERKYLPNIFNGLFSDFNNYIDKKVQKIIKNLVKKKNVIEHTYVILQIEILIYIGMCRNKNIFKFNECKYELKFIRELCKENNLNNLQVTYSNYFNKVDQFIDFVSKKSNFNIKVSNNGRIALLTRIKLIEFKIKFELKEIYLINRNFEKGYKEIYVMIMDIISKYFKFKIDSLDRISIFLVLKEYLNKEKDTEGKTIIVYDTLQRLLIEEIYSRLKIRGIEIKSLVSEYSLDTYLSENEVKNIMLFESIDLDDFSKLICDINIIRAAFPLGELDYLKIKKMLK